MFGFYRVATCSPVVKVADAEFNTARILELAEKAAGRIPRPSFFFPNSPSPPIPAAICSTMKLC